MTTELEIPTRAVDLPEAQALSTDHMLEAVHLRLSSSEGRRRAPLLIALLAGLCISGSTVAVAAAMGAFRTVSTHVVVTGPMFSESPLPEFAPSQPPEYTTTLVHARAVAGFSVLTLPPSIAELESVTVIPPIVLADGQPWGSSNPTIRLAYRTGTATITAQETSGTPGTPLTFYVKSTGDAPHHGTVAGLSVLYTGSPSATGMVTFKTTGGTTLLMGASPSITLTQWGAILEDLR